MRLKLIIATISLSAGCASAWPQSCKYDLFSGKTQCKCNVAEARISKSNRVTFRCDGERLPITFDADRVETGGEK